MITRRRFHAALVAVFLAALALALLGPAGTAAAEPRLDRMLATEQSLTRKIERAERRLGREQKKLARAASDLERRCAGQSIDRERRTRCADLSDRLELNRERLDRDAENWRAIRKDWSSSAQKSPVSTSARNGSERS